MVWMDDVIHWPCSHRRLMSQIAWMMFSTDPAATGSISSDWYSGGFQTTFCKMSLLMLSFMFIWCLMDHPLRKYKGSSLFFISVHLVGVLDFDVTHWQGGFFCLKPTDQPKHGYFISLSEAVFKYGSNETLHSKFWSSDPKLEPKKWFCTIFFKNPNFKT